MTYLVIPALVLAFCLWVRGYWLGAAAALLVFQQAGAFYEDPQWSRSDNLTLVVILAYAAVCVAPVILWRAVNKPPAPLRDLLRHFKRSAEAPRGVSRQGGPPRLSIAGGTDQH